MVICVSLETPGLIATTDMTNIIDTRSNSDVFISVFLDKSYVSVVNCNYHRHF